MDAMNDAAVRHTPGQTKSLHSMRLDEGHDGGER